MSDYEVKPRPSSGPGYRVYGGGVGLLNLALLVLYCCTKKPRTRRLAPPPPPEENGDFQPSELQLPEPTPPLAPCSGATSPPPYSEYSDSEMYGPNSVTVENNKNIKDSKGAGNETTTFTTEPREQGRRQDDRELTRSLLD